MCEHIQPERVRAKRCDAGKGRISKIQVVERLALKGFVLVGEYAGIVRSHCVLRCPQGHEWNALIGNVIKKNGTGCPHCKGMARLTLSEISTRLSSRGIRMLGGDPRAAKKAEFECDQGHAWSARIDTVLSGGGCPKCRPNRPLTRDEVNDRVADRGYHLVGPYINAGTMAVFECSEGHKWNAVPDNILRGKGCPSCAEYGFNPAYPACFYTIRIFSEDAEYVGFGITKDRNTRFSYHARAIKEMGFDFEVLDTVEFASGHDARALETLMKESIEVVDTGIKGFRKEATHAKAYPMMKSIMESLTV